MTLVVYCLECDRPKDEHDQPELEPHEFNPCKGCTAYGPPHLVSEKCESGGYAHCSCGICF